MGMRYMNVGMKMDCYLLFRWFMDLLLIDKTLNWKCSRFRFIVFDDYYLNLYRTDLTNKLNL